MSDDGLNADDAVIRRAASVLGSPERFGDDFERSLVEAIRAERPLDRTLAQRRKRWSSAWWRAPGVELSPLAGLAIAAGIAAVAVLGTLGIAKRTAASVQTTASGTRDTVTFVRFVFVGQAKSVNLVGDFNAWGGRATALEQTANGAWTVSVPMTNGRHEYAFIVDGARWVPDPLAPTSTDDFDTKSSIVSVGT